MSLPLPPELRQQLDAFRRRLFVQESLWAAATFLGGLIAALAVLFALDRFTETPKGVRLLLLAAGLAVAGYGAGKWVVNWVLHPRDDRRLSLLVQKKYRNLGDNLLSAIELAEGRITDDTISPELRQAAVAGVARQAGALDFARAVNWRATARIATGAAAGLALAGVLGVACLPALRATLVRFVNPFAEVVRHTFTRFKPMPDRVVARGEPFSVECAIDEAASQWKPPTVGFQVGTARPGQVAAGQSIQVPGQTEETALKVWAGDAKETVRIRPETRPALTGVRARVALPAYLRLPPVETACNGTLTAVEGAQVAFFGQATRPLASMDAFAAPKSPQGAPARPEAEPAQPALALAPSLAGSGFTLADLAIAKDSKQETQVTLSWTDTLGLAGAAPHAITVKPRPDQVPEVRCPDMASTIAILPEEALPLSLEASDDFGVKALGIHCRHTVKDASKDAPKEPVWTSRVLPVAQGAPDKAKAAGEFTFSPKLLGIPAGSVVELQAGAGDYCPDHAEGLSQVYRIHVLTAADHAKLVQDMMVEMSGQMDERANAAQQIRDAIAELAKDPAKAATPEGAKKLEDLKAAAEKNAEDIRKLDDKLTDIAREANKNKDIPKDTLEKVAEMSKDMQDAAKESDEAAKAMEKAQSAQSPEDKKKELDKAAKHEEEAEKKLRKNSRKMDEVQKKLDARNFANRLEREATLQDERSGEAKKLVALLVGATPETMTKEEKALVDALADGQRKSAESAKAIAADLAASYARSHHEPYHAITDDMEKKDLDGRNAELAAQYGSNQMFKATGKGKELADLYRAWAKMLKKEGGGGEGGGGEGQSLPAELLAAFMTMIENEQELREETRAAGQMAQARGEELDAKLLDKKVDAAKEPQERAAIARELEAASGVLGAGQEDQLRFLARTYEAYVNPPESDRAVDLIDPELAGDYGTFVEGKRPLPQKVVQLMNATAKAMDDATKRLKDGKPDSEAIAAQTEAIERLASIFDQDGGGQSSKKGQKPGPQMAQKMAKKMMKGKGNQPGMGQTGNGAANADKGGTTHTDPTLHKEIGKGGGIAGGFVPPEFQGDIDAYHAEVDKLEIKP